MSTERQTKRQRRKPQDFYSGSSAEEKLIAQAIANSRVDIHRPQGNLDIPYAPTFYPTIEEFSVNPLVYIDSISPIARKFGICKIVPPKGWNPPMCKCQFLWRKTDSLLILLWLAFGELS
mmetsp:Transcript_33088/g.76253  ORF Transcript_33088/g.76253 Transcript_33088/m.76253 type:complete len:120 (-) Transcript_33088:81-440(-)